MRNILPKSQLDYEITMKLYIYENCPFSARVRYVAGMLNIPLDVITLDYDDDQTTKELIGSKQVPLLIKESGEALSESLDIIQFLLESVNSWETAQPAQATLDWQRSAFLPLQNRLSTLVEHEFT